MATRVAVLGCAQTKHESRKEGIHLTQMLYETVKAALADCSLTIGQIDTVVSASCDVLDGISIGNCFTCESMGAFLKEETRVEDDGSFAAIYAAMRIMSGHFDTALVIAYSKGSQTQSYYYSGLSCDPFTQRPLGLEAHSLAALQCRAYMQRYSVTESDLARVCVRNRENGLKNPFAVLRTKIHETEVLESPYWCEPLREKMIAPDTDGACAIVLGSEKIARTAKNSPAWVSGMGYCTDAYYPGYRDLWRLPSSVKAAQHAYDMARVKRPAAELDVVEVSAPYPHQELMLAEALGLCGEGEGKRFAEADAIAMPALNPSGGCLCANPIIGAGLIRIAETALQVTQRAGDRQVGGAKTGAAHGSSGQCLQANSVVVLRGE